MSALNGGKGLQQANFIVICKEEAESGLGKKVGFNLDSESPPAKGAAGDAGAIDGRLFFGIRRQSYKYA